MKKQLKGVDNQTVVHCPTKELAFKVIEIVNAVNPDTYEGNTLENPTYWHTYTDKTCYWVNNGEYTDINYYKRNYHPIITAEEFIRLNSPEFKVGDRVNVIEGDNTNRKNLGLGTVTEVDKLAALQPNIQVRLDSGGNSYVYPNPSDHNRKFVVELVEEETIEPVKLSISRANLKEIHNKACIEWKNIIEDVISKHDQFEESISFDIDTVKKGYHAASSELVGLLKQLIPLPSITKTVEVVRWVNINKDNTTRPFLTEKEAKKFAFGKNDIIAVAVEMKGSYTTTVEYDYDEFENLPF